MSARVLCGSASAWGAKRCSVIMQHLRSQGGGAAEPEVLFRDVSSGEGGVAYREVLLNRPRALNTLNLDMMRLILPQMKVAAEDPSVAMVVMEGAGDKAFCAGGDVRTIMEAEKAGQPMAREYFQDGYQLNHAINTFPKPYVAIMDGITMGGGVGLSIHGPFRVATEHTVFAMPEVSIGFFPNVGGSFFLPRLAGALGMFLSLTGHRLKGRDVQHAGIATHFIARVAVPQLRERLAALCPQLMDFDPQERLGSVKSLLDKVHEENLVIDPQPFSLDPHCAKIDSCFSRDSVEEVLRALREEGGDWGAKQVKILAKMSPTSLKITHRELTEGARMGSLAECLEMESRMSWGCWGGQDFYEGVRAVLVDKDNSPQWDPPTLEGVTEEIMRRHFDPLPADQEWKLPS